MYIPDNISRVIDMIEENGYRAYLVGGCVRDSIIGREPNDYDVASSALPEEIVRIFPHTALSCVHVVLRRPNQAADRP